MLTSSKKQLLGKMLLQKKLITEDQLQIALTEQRIRSGKLGQILVDYGFIPEAVLNQQVGIVRGRISIDLSTMIADPQALVFVEKAMAKRLRLVPVSFDTERQELLVAMADVDNIVLQDRLALHINGQIKLRFALASEHLIEKTIDDFYGFSLSIDAILTEIDEGGIATNISHQALQDYSQPIVRLVNLILLDAVKANASDIHFEPERGYLKIRYRVDGVMRQVRCLHQKYWSAIVIRLKILSVMDIAEFRAPQDGRFSITISGQHMDFRVSTFPVSHGENMVLRIVNRDKDVLSLMKMGLSETISDALFRVLQQPCGMTIVTGPTGSGKTMSLYAMLKELNTSQVNIMTMEDPVEYPMDGVRQSELNRNAKMNFASGIRALMRQDPDIMLVGEIRDPETAEIALRAAMTGHKVFTSLHTRSAVSALQRLMDLGISREAMAGNISAIIAQRLIRRLCKHCKQSVEKTETDLSNPDAPVIRNLYSCIGCKQCGHSGYRGRFAVLEVLEITAEIDGMIRKKLDPVEILMSARLSGWKPLTEQGLPYLSRGETTLEELERVLGNIDGVSRL